MHNPVSIAREIRQCMSKDSQLDSSLDSSLDSKTRKSHKTGPEITPDDNINPDDFRQLRMISSGAA